MVSFILDSKWINEVIIKWDYKISEDKATKLTMICGFFLLSLVSFFFQIDALF